MFCRLRSVRSVADQRRTGDDAELEALEYAVGPGGIHPQIVGVDDEVLHGGTVPEK